MSTKPKKAAEVARTYAKITTQSEVDTINRYLQGTVATISPKLEEMLKRLETAADLLRKHGSRLVVAAKLRHLYKYSTATAYRDIDDAMEAFAPTTRVNRAFYVDLMLEKMFSTHAKAIVAGDLKTAASVEKNIMAAIDKFMGDADSFPIDELQPPRFIIGHFPELVGRKLPDNWEQQVKNILREKRSGNFAGAEEAKVVGEEEQL
ncbi:hypothetical protein [Hymenobacter sp. BT190]|uniref:hypothetical protein n=1 Tax=Hymenobacter sp. BT190 TaxID=2763505 RepID=UPI001651AD7B|nr:hypothetical protein [Hymenobacter sp. BT190]MBC6698074.1 hypothetical protein [Hymenobacter sp. BT190]